jgi:DNA polymerase-3 subunit epsilon
VLCFLEKNSKENAYKEDADTYNQKVKTALQSIVDQQETYAIIESHSDHRSCVLVEKGKFYGLGQLPADLEITETEQLKSFITNYPENLVIRSMVQQYADRNPKQVFRFDN